MEIKYANVEDIPKLIPVLLELRPHLVVEDIEHRFIEQQKEGFQIIYIGSDTEAYALLGFRTLNFFYSGKTLYIDDLVTLPEHRGNGYGSILLDWVKDYAKNNKYDHLSLDSWFLRRDAHRLYLNKELVIEALHFGRPVAEF